MAIDIKEEIANYLLNNCFLIGNVDSTREKYYYVINHEESFRQLFQPIGYTLVIHRNLRVVQLINNHGTGRLALKKYESIMLLIFRLLYVEKRESLSTSEDKVVVTVEEIKNEYQEKSYNLEYEYKYEIHKLEKENSRLHKIINKFYETIDKFIHWICAKFDIAEEDNLIRDFQRETNTFIDSEKQIKHEEMEKEWDLER